MNINARMVFVVLWLTLLTTQSGTRANANAIVYNTSDSPFQPGFDNQGWWSDLWVNGGPNNHNYSTGAAGATGIRPARELRSFFTFDLSSLTGPVISATLELQNYSTNTGTLGLFDVHTDTETLNNTGGTNNGIFTDLGTGASYGTFPVSGSLPTTHILSFQLNQQAIDDINAAAGGFFSIGGRSMEFQAVPNFAETIFGSSGGDGPQRLIVEVIPEPTTLSIIALGAFLLKRRRVELR